MSTEDPAEAIAHALARLRGRRPGPPPLDPGYPRGEGGRHGRHGEEAHRHAPDPHGPHGFGPPPWAHGGRRDGLAWMRMLDALAASADPLSVSAIGEAIAVDQPRASRLVQQAVDRGLVRREADPDDARRTRIALTEEGALFVRTVRGQRRDALRSALAGFTAEESRELARLLQKLADNWGA